MTEKKAKTETAAAKEKQAAKKPAGAKAAPAKAPVAAKQAKPAAAVPGKSVTLTQIASPIGRQAYQRATLIGLGLNKMNRTRTLADTPSIRGMIEKVKHLLKVE